VDSSYPVQPNSIVAIAFDKWSTEGRPVNPSIVSTRPDLSWSELIQITSPHSYIATVGKPLGPIPRCRGCKREFRSRTEMRLQVKVTFHPPASGPYTGRLNLCLDPACVQLASQKYLTSGLEMPPFDGRVLVANDKRVSELPNVKGIQWIS
jgi:hypothetical protein